MRILLFAFSFCLPLLAPPTGKVFARAEIEGKSGTQTKGVVEFTLVSNTSLAVDASVENVVAGKHGIHIHEKGDCSKPDASSAGEHLNPHAGKHGNANVKGSHLGDLGNIDVGQDGRGTLKLVLKLSRADEWKQFLNRSVIVHSQADDLKSQPAGNSGERIGCGVIKEVTDYVSTSPFVSESAAF